MSKAPKDLRIPIMMSTEEVEAIDEWRYANKIATRAEAVRRLCQVGIFLDTAVQSLSAQFDKEPSGTPEFAHQLSNLVLRILMVTPFAKAHPVLETEKFISSKFAIGVLKRLEDDEFREMFGKAVRNEAKRRILTMRDELERLEKPKS